MISYLSHIGKTHDSLPPLPVRAAGKVSLNTPVGSCLDHLGRVWLADTAHNRLLVFDASLQHLLASFGQTGSAPGEFNMPFRLLAHPDKPWIYVTDMGNRRIQLLEYTPDLEITPLLTFGNQAPINLTGPNGLVFHDGQLCVADEFFEGADGESRLVVLDEEGHFIRDIRHIRYPDNSHEPLQLLWPQGLTLDQQGNIYIANTGFNTLVRCNWQGEAVPFAINGKAYLEGMELARDVSCIRQHLLVPGASANAIAVYDLNGRRQGSLQGFYAPIQITAGSEKDTLLITEPILASLQLHQVRLNDVKGGAALFTQVLNRVGDDRDQPGQLHFVTSAAGQPPAHPADDPLSPFPWVRQWLDTSQQQLETYTNRIQTPALPSWLSLSLSWQTEWLLRWQQSWLRIMLGERLDNPAHLLWLLDAGNYQLQASGSTRPDGARPVGMPLVPGSLGMTTLKTRHRLAGQLAPDKPLLVVCNYLTSLVTIYQYHPLLDELVPYRVFGSRGSQPWQLLSPQGISIDPVNQDILIADSGNHRIARWRLTRSGIAGLVDTFGTPGDGPGQFHTPSDVALDEQGHCYVTDQFNHRIQVFDARGQWLYSFGQPGYATEGDQFLLPTSLAYEQGHLVVSDLVNRAIKLFRPDGTFVASFAGFGADASKGQLWMPYLMHVRNGQIYLPDCALNRVNVYQLELESQP
ncbi:NHL repeat-containing protein [Marinospirillum alkaliphilum]|uniref:NHL repeat-containing protein n=1 Tax=Marinospirillum alkaliphilum DSM 21637 TaxID=1122209 RepID=A0A1K1W3U6_9GAMM|nr:NHL repeat-containing protein [Marinospirillum alkaliphilum]SFX32088.1 NHL repeat-containing protein [Marinospirillum alkaliphilum DSM 21637]